MSSSCWGIKMLCVCNPRLMEEFHLLLQILFTWCVILLGEKTDGETFWEVSWTTWGHLSGCASSRECFFSSRRLDFVCLVTWGRTKTCWPFWRVIEVQWQLHFCSFSERQQKRDRVVPAKKKTKNKQTKEKTLWFSPNRGVNCLLSLVPWAPGLYVTASHQKRPDLFPVHPAWKCFFLKNNCITQCMTKERNVQVEKRKRKDTITIN